VNCDTGDPWRLSENASSGVVDVFLKQTRKFVTSSPYLCWKCYLWWPGCTAYVGRRM